MKCNVCDQRKGRRYCPAKNATICAQCCGEKRVLVIDCPETCEYLKVGRSYERDHLGERFSRMEKPAEQEKIGRVMRDFEPVIVDLQTMIALERRTSKDLVDAEVAEALDCALATLRTEDRGIIYETTSGNLRAEAVRRQVSSVIQSHRYPKESDRTRLGLKDALECLEALRMIVSMHMESGSSALSFVDFLVRHLPRGGELAPSQPSIIIPGR